MPKLTKRFVDTAEPKPETWFAWDEDLAGFGLSVMPNGIKSYVVRYRTSEERDRRLTLGRRGVLTPDQARIRAREIPVGVAGGTDPLAERGNRRRGSTMNDLFDRYEDVHLPHLSPRTSAEQKRLIAKHLRPEVGTLKVESCNTRDARRVHFAMRAMLRQANSVIGMPSKARTLAEEWGMRAEGLTPCVRVKKSPDVASDRFLSPEEVGRLGLVLVEAETVGLPRVADETEPKAKHSAKPENRSTSVDPIVVAVVRMLLLTGARLFEILELEWDHVDFAGGTLALPHQKGRAAAPSGGDRRTRPADRVGGGSGNPYGCSRGSSATRRMPSPRRSCSGHGRASDTRPAATMSTCTIFAIPSAPPPRAPAGMPSRFATNRGTPTSRYRLAKSPRDSDPTRALTEAVADTLSAALEGRQTEVVSMTGGGRGRERRRRPARFDRRPRDGRR